MKYLYWTAALVAAMSAPLGAHTDMLRIATWNLGWHVSQQDLSPWISQCSQTFTKAAQGV